MLLVVLWGALGHNYGAASINPAPGVTFGQCAPDSACEENRKCAFGTIDNYEIARSDLFRVTGYSENCIDQCVCTPSSVNDVSDALHLAQSTNHWDNISLCENEAIKQALFFHTSGYLCESVFRLAQAQLIRLCGRRNGVSCQGLCTEQYQIDTPIPLCEQKKDIEDGVLYAILGYVLLGCILWSWTAGVDINDQRYNTLSQRFRHTRFSAKSSKGDSELDALLGSFF